MTPGHAPTELIADYAAGVLSPGMSLLVASHLTYCPACRDRVARLEALCGALLADGAAVAPAPRCLRRALARLDAPEAVDAPLLDHGAPLPAPLCRRLAAPVCDLRWQAVLPGLAVSPIEGFPAERVELVRARPGVRVPARGLPGREGALVLSGRLDDGAHVFRRGELALAAPGAAEGPEAVGDESCLCLVVLPADPAPDPRG